MNLLNLFSQKLSLLGQFWQEKKLVALLRWNVLLLIFQLFFLINNFSDLPQKVPLFYSRPWGDSRLASANNLFLLPGLSIIFLLINNFLSSLFLKNNSLFSYLLSTFSLIFSLFCSISLVKIITLVS